MSDLSHLNVQGEDLPVKSRGCLFYGCLTGLGVALLLGSLAVYAGYQLRSMLAEAGRRYTADAPKELPRITVAPEEYGGIKRRLLDFREALEGEGPAELRLTTRDLNAILNREAVFQGLGRYFYVAVEAERLRLLFNADLEELPPGICSILGWECAGRYLSGEGTFGFVKGSGGQTHISIAQLELGGSRLPDQLLELMESQSIEEQLESEDDLQEYAQRIDEIKIEAGLLILRKLGRSPSTGPTDGSLSGDSKSIGSE